MRLFWHELKGELLLYTRSRELAFFTFLLPMIFFVLLGSTYGNDTVDGVKGSQASSQAGMIGYGAISIAFAGLAIVLVIRRETGILKRLRATPLPRLGLHRGSAVGVPARLRGRGRGDSSSSAGCCSGSPCLTSSARSCSRCCSARSRSAALGVGLTAVIRSAEGASAVVNAIYLPAAFLAGAFFSPAHFPRCSVRSPTSCR